MFKATLDLARYAQGLEQHKITGVHRPDNTFRCMTTLSAEMGKYTDGGTCWFLTGACEGLFGRIEAGTDQWIRLQDVFEQQYAAGDNVALSPALYFETQNLVNAINHVLYDYPIMAIYEGTEAAPGDYYIEDPDTGYMSAPGAGMRYTREKTVYDIPDPVTRDIRRVEIELNSYRDETEFTICHYWRINGHQLIIQPKGVYKEGGRIRIHYVMEHGPLLNHEVISKQVDRNYLRKMAAVWLWTHEIQIKHKDNPIAVDMFNQARIDEETLRRQNIPAGRLLPKDPCFSW